MKAKIKNLEQFYSSKKGFAGTPEAGIFDRVPHEIEVTI